MGFIKKHFRRISKGIKKLLKPVGKALKDGLGEVGKFFGEMGPLGTLALTLMLPGIGAAWSSFGAWAGAQGGLIGGVMQGVAQAGNFAGRVYSSVTGFVSDVVGTVAGNTIGKIPVGGGKNLTDAYNGFRTFVGNQVDSVRMKMGLPTSNITAETIAEEAEVLNNVTIDKGYDESINLEPMNLLDADIGQQDYVVSGDEFKNPLNPSEEVVTAPRIGGKSHFRNLQKMNSQDLKKLGFDDNFKNEVLFGDRNLTTDEIVKINSFKPTVAPVVDAENSFQLDIDKAELRRAKLNDEGRLTDVIVGFDKDVKYIGANGEEVFNMNPVVKSVPTDILDKDQLASNQRISNFIDYNNNRVKNFENKFGADQLEKFDAGQISASIGEYDASKISNVGTAMFGVQEAYDVAMGENEYMPTGGGSFDPMKSDTTSMNDYTRSVYPSYVQNGYRGAPNPRDLYQMGFYGDDMFTKYMREMNQFAVQPTVQVGGMV